MKYSLKLMLLFFLIAGIAGNSFAQKRSKKHAVKVVPAPVSEIPKMVTGDDSLSYAIGVQVAGFYKDQGFDSMNYNMMIQAMKDIYSDTALLLNEDQSNMKIQQKLREFMTAKLDKTKKAGEEFLAENAKKPNVVTLPSGLQYEIIKRGDGPIPTAADTVKANYIGTLLDGKEFDNSYKRGEPLEIPVTGVIKGWVEALQLMPVGSTWKLFIPSDLAYGDRGAGGAIPGGATLEFTIELLSINGK